MILYSVEDIINALKNYMKLRGFDVKNITKISASTDPFLYGIDFHSPDFPLGFISLNLDPDIFVVGPMLIKLLEDRLGLDDRLFRVFKKFFKNSKVVQ